MGFRSEIYIKCKIEKAFEFKHFLQTYKEKFSEDLQQTEEFYTDDNYLYLVLHDWKFYSCFPEVEFITDFVEQESLEGYIGMLAVHEDDTTSEWGAPYEVDLYISITIGGM